MNKEVTVQDLVALGRLRLKGLALSEGLGETPDQRAILSLMPQEVMAEHVLAAHQKRVATRKQDVDKAKARLARRIRRALRDWVKETEAAYKSSAPTQVLMPQDWLPW